MNCPWNSSLPERIEANPSLWLAKIKSATAAEEAAAEIERLKTTAAEDAIIDLASVVSDLSDAVIELAGMIV